MSILESARRAAKKGNKNTESPRISTKSTNKDTKKTNTKEDSKSTSILESARRASTKSSSTISGGAKRVGTPYTTAKTTTDKPRESSITKYAGVLSNPGNNSGSEFIKRLQDNKKVDLQFPNNKFNPQAVSVLKEVNEQRNKRNTEYTPPKASDMVETARQFGEYSKKLLDYKTDEAGKKAYLKSIGFNSFGEFADAAEYYARYAKYYKNTVDALNQATANGDFEEYSKYSPLPSKTEEELLAAGWKKNEEGQWKKRDGLIGANKTYTGEDDRIYTYINDESKRGSIESADLAEQYSIAGGQGVSTTTYETNGYAFLTDEEKAAYNYLYYYDRLNGTNNAETYLQNIGFLLQERASGAEAERLAKLAKKYPVASSVYSLGTNFANGMMFPTKLVATATGNYEEDAPMLDKFGTATTAIRGSVSEDMGAVGQVMYGAGMSIGDMLVARAMGGGSDAGYQFIMSSNVASSTISNEKANGASDEKAIIMALGSAAIEWITEGISAKMLRSNPGSITKYISYNALTEGLEEGAANAGNLALDIAVSTYTNDRNQIERRIDYLVSQEGYTEDEALKEAWLEALDQNLQDSVTGFVAGLGMSTLTASPAIVQTGVDKIRSIPTAKTPTDSPVTPVAPATERTTKPVATTTVTGKTPTKATEVPVAERLEALSQNNEPISVEEVKEATGFGDSGAELVADYASAEGNSFLQVEKQVRSAYMEGMKNPDVDVKSRKGSFSPMQENAYKAGQIDRKASDNMRRVQGENAVIRKDSGFVAENLPSDTKRSEVKALDIMAKGVGVKAYVVEGDSLKGNAEINRRTGEVPIDANFQREAIVNGKKQQVSIVFHGAHEMAVHGVVDRAFEEGSAFVYALYNNLAGDEASLPVTLAEQKRSAYAAQGVNISLTQAMEEISASNILTVYNNNEAKFHRAIENIVKDKKAYLGLRKYIDSLNIMIAKLKAFLKGASKAERMQIEADMREVIRLRDMFESAFRKAVENTNNAQNKQSGGTNSSKNLEIKINEEYNGSIDYSLEEKPHYRSKRTKYNEYNTRGMQWAYNTSTEIGDRKVLFNPYTGKYVLVEATKDDVGFIELKTGTYEKLKEDVRLYESNKQREFADNERDIDTAIYNFESGQNNNTWSNVDDRNGRKGIQNAEVSKGKSQSNGATDSQTSDGNLNNDDIRFSLKESVEVTKDLIAVHNTSESQLLDAVTRGQFIMPSTAITNKSHTAFGDISVVFSKDTIDPKTNTENKLYGADAWTPTQTTLKINPKFDNTKTEAIVEKIKKTIGNGWSQIFDVNGVSFKNAIKSAQGSVYGAYSENIGVQTAYAVEKGIIETVPRKNGKIDVNALKNTLDENLNKDEVWRNYKKWLGDISNDIITSYDKASTQDILNNMKAQPETAKGFNLSENGELTVPAVEYSSIDEMRSNKNRLSENAETEAKAVGSEFVSWANNIADNLGIDAKSVIKAINTSFNNRYDAMGIANTFKTNGVAITQADAKNLQSLYKKAVELPTRYFEAKPRRGVDISEVAYVVLPSNTSENLKSLLNENGVSFVEYEQGNTEARIEGLNSNKDVMFSLKDSEGNTLTETQQEYFKGSKVRDDNGNLLVMYRGDSSDFSVFDRKKSKPSNLYGRGFYFTNSKSHAGQYGKVRGFYLDIKHPVSTTETTITKSQLRKFLQVVSENEDYGLENYGYGATVESVLQSTYGKSDFLMLNDVSQTAIGDLVETVELFNEVNGTDYDGIVLDTETVTFNSEQAKLTTNENPTSNPDINFSLKEPVEETKNLIAVHNMQVSELERTLDLGGLPMPSIAIIKAQRGHSEYGDVSLVFSKDTIDPKSNKDNKVYGGDAWTPTYPTIEYKPNEKIAKKISDKYYEFSRKFGYDESRPLYNYVNDLERQLNSNNGEAGMLEELYNDTRVMQFYLLDSGKGKVETINKETRTELTDAEVKMHEFFIEELGADVVDAVVFDGKGTPVEHRQNYFSKYGDAIREAYKKLLIQDYQFTEEEVQNVLDSTKTYNYMKFVRDAYNYRHNGRVTIKTEADHEATQNAIKEKAGEDYRKWVDSLFKGIEEKSGIRNNVNYYTNSGNARSWEALHWENNLENVVKVMKSESDVGSGTFFAAHSIWGVSAKNYGSIEEIKADSDRLKQLSEEEYNKVKESYGERLTEIAHSIMDKSERNPFIAVDNAMECIVDAVRSSKTKSGILNNLKQYKQLTVTETTVNDIVSLVSDIANMPTEYFEAKPKRAVGLNEIATAIIPDSTSQDTKARLDNMGIKYVEYESGNEQARLDALNSLEDVKFSLKDTDINTKDRKELLDIIEHLKGEFETTKFAKADPKKLAKITKDILKEYSSKADFDETYNAINELYNYMANGEDGNVAWSEVYNRAYEVAQGIVENALVTDKTMYQEYKHLRDYLRNTPMKFTESDSVPTSYETFTEFRRANMGRLKFATDGMSIDKVYQELSELYPEFFNAEEQINSADQLERMIDVLDELQPTTANPFRGQIEQASMQLANDITSRFFDVPQAKPTFADKAERRAVEEKIKGGKKLEKLREQKNAKIKEKIAEGREKVKEAILGERIAGIRDTRKAKHKLESRISKMSEKKKANVLRAKITRHAGELNKTLLKATDQKHIPPELQNAVVALLYNINMESNYSYDPESNSYKKNEKGLPTNKTQAFRDLKAVYAEIAKNNDYGLTLASELVDTTQEGVANLFDEVMKLSDTKIADMTSEELTKIYDAIRIIEHSISTANKMFAMQKWEGLKETGAAFDKAVSTRRPKHALMNKKMTLDIETPITFFSHFGDAGNELFQALRNAQDNEQVMIDELAEVVQGIVSLEERQKLEKNVKHFTTEGGEKLTLSKAHIMDIYLLYNREQGKKHLLYDPESGYLGEGIHQPEVRDGIHKIRRNPESTRLTKTDIENILAELLPEERTIADKIQKATLKLAEWGNEACLEVFGYEKFNDPDYWTVKSARESIAQTIEKNKDSARSIKNMGSAKSVEPEAKNPVDIYGVFRLFDQHASDMICYSAWLGVMEDATKLYNFTFRDAEGNKTRRTFKSMLEKYAGEGGEKYYLNLLKDIQNGIGTAPDTTTEGAYTKLYGAAAKAKVAFKLTVIAQQPMAIVRASNVINPLSIMQATAKGGVNLPVWAVSKVKNIAPKQSGQLLQEWYGGWERALKYAPIASRKAIGGYEIGSSSSGLAGVLYQPKTVKGKTVDAIKESPLWMAGKADEVTWGLLWNACEIETRRKNKSLEKGSEAFYKATAELFNKVINETQVVDGVLQRSQLMRSSSGWVKPLTTFKGEPTMALNGVIRAYDQLRYETGEGRGKAIKKFSRAVSVFLMSAVFTAFARSLAVGVTGDDDEEYWKKVWKSFSGVQGDEETWFDYAKNIGLKSDAVNNINPLTWLPISSEIISGLQGYDTERLDVASIGDFVNAGTTFIDSLDEEGKYTVGYATRNLLLKVAEFTGYSPNNLIRDIEGAIRTVRNETGDVRGLYDMEKMRTKPASNVPAYIDILYKAYTTDDEAYEYIYNDLIENGVDAEKIESGMESRMKKAEGVEKATDLSKRYMTPDVEKKYDKSLGKVKTSRVWKTANTTQRKNAESDLYDFLTSTTDAMEKTRAEARAYGVDETEYTLYQLAIEMADQPKGQKGSGSYDMTEKAEAVNSLNLGDREIAYFFGKGLNETAKEEINDVLQDGIDMKEYVNFKAATSEMKADKNAKGNSIPNSKKRKVVNYLNSAGLTEEEWMYFYYEVMNYKK